MWPISHLEPERKKGGGVMLREVKRNTWGRFLKKFSTDNRYRFASVVVSHRGKARVTISENIPFVGAGLCKAGRLIDAIELFTGQWSPEQLTVPSVSMKQPVRLLVDGEPDLDQKLVVEGEDGSRFEVHLDANRVDPKYLIEKLAYTIAERRGFAPGSELESWLEAERTVQQVESQFV